MNKNKRLCYMNDNIIISYCFVQGLQLISIFSVIFRGSMIVDSL